MYKETFYTTKNRTDNIQINNQTVEQVKQNKSITYYITPDFVRALESRCVLIALLESPPTLYFNNK